MTAENLRGKVYREFYSAYYTAGPEARTGRHGMNRQTILQGIRDKTSNHDSPDDSRKSILDRLISFYDANTALGRQGLILDLGAGKQIIETELEAGILPHAKKGLRIVTVDIADILARQLLIRHYFPDQKNSYPHVQADGSTLPFKDEAFESAISNMALDFMPEEARHELCRVLKEGAPVFLNLHHPSRIPPDLDARINRLARQIYNKHRLGGQASTSKQLNMLVLEHDRFLRDNRVLFEEPEQIQAAFESCGFTVQRIALNSTDRDTWWEVDMVKSEAFDLWWTREGSNF